MRRSRSVTLVLLSSTLFLAACEDNSYFVPPAGAPVDAANEPQPQNDIESLYATQVAAADPGTTTAPSTTSTGTRRASPIVQRPVTPVPVRPTPFSMGSSLSNRSTVPHSVTPAPIRSSPMSAGSSLFGGASHVSTPAPAIHTGGAISTVHGGFGASSAAHASVSSAGS